MATGGGVLVPTYEYVCNDCRKRVSLFYLSIRRAEEEIHRCPLCRGVSLERLVSRFSVVRSSGLSSGSNDEVPGMAELEKGDPKTLARWMRRMSDEVGQPIEPEMEGVLDRLEAGEDPEKIEADLGVPGASGGAGESPDAGDV